MLSAFASGGCVCNRFGTLAARRTVTATAEVVDVYGIGAVLRTNAADAGITLGWRHVTYVRPLENARGQGRGGHWTLGWLPRRSGTPFFLAARSFGFDLSHYPQYFCAHAGYAEEAFTFVARSDESLTIDFHYLATDPMQTRLTLEPFPFPSNP